MEKQWKIFNKKADFNQIASTHRIDPVIARVLTNRGIVGDDAIHEYLYGDTLYDPLDLKDMAEAVAMIKGNLNKHIRIISDYDIDGVMANYILYRGLTRLGANVDYRIPHRIRDGYGMNTRLVQEAHEDAVDIILTCDNGVSAHEAVMLAKAYGMTVIVTDHHDIGELVAADLVVNPKRKDDSSKNKDLCGAAIAWKLIVALGADPDSSLLPFAAFATIGDIMDLRGENRVLVKRGLHMLSRTDHVGILALAKAAGMSIAEISTYHIGFVLGPCINAAGRLEDANRALALLLEEDPNTAERMAEHLVALNNERKLLTEKGVTDACAQIGESLDKILVVHLPDLHESIAGIVAGKLKELYGHPAFVLTGHGTCKGSGRSVEGYSMFQALQVVSDCLVKFGGHPLAAGLSIEEDRINEFRSRINDTCPVQAFIPKVMIDVPMPIWAVTKRIVEELKLLAPFGKGNEKPLFGDPNVYAHSARLIGKEKKFVRTDLQSLVKTETASGLSLYGQVLSGVYFQDGTELYEVCTKSKHLRVAYEPQINVFNGKESLQLMIKDWQKV